MLPYNQFVKMLKGNEPKSAPQPILVTEPVKKPKKTKKVAPVATPRVGLYRHPTGKLLKNYRCLTCSSFVSKNQPHCYSCMGIPHIGKKKIAAKKKEVASNIDWQTTTNPRTVPGKTDAVASLNRRERSVILKSVTKKTPLGTQKGSVKSILKAKSRKKKAISHKKRVKCSSCFRYTKCKDGVCMICKTQQQSSPSPAKTTNESIDLTNENQTAHPKPVTRNERSTKMNTVASKSPRKVRTRRSAPSTSDLEENCIDHASLDDGGHSIFAGYLENSFDLTGDAAVNQTGRGEIETVVSDLENLLASPAVATEQQDDDDNMFVSMRDINNMLSPN